MFASLFAYGLFENFATSAQGKGIKKNCKDRPEQKYNVMFSIDALASWFVRIPRSSGPGLSPGFGHCVVFSGKK